MRRDITALDNHAPRLLDVARVGRKAGARTDPPNPCDPTEISYCLMPYNAADAAQENSILIVDKGPTTESGSVEVRMMDYSTGYTSFKELHPIATGMHLSAGVDNNGMWCFLVDHQGNLVGVNSGVSPSGFVEVHRLAFAGAIPYQNFDLQVATPMTTRAPFDEWDWMLDSESNLVCIKKGPLTATSRSEGSILKAADDYSSFIRTGAIGMHMTASMNHYGDWAFLLDGMNNLLAVRRPSLTDASIKVVRMTKASNWMSFDLEDGGAVLPQGTNQHQDVHWVFELDSNDALVCIKEGPVTAHDLTEVHRLTHASNYATFDMNEVSTAAPCRQPYFTDSDGSR